MLGKIEGRRSGQQRMRCLGIITDSMDIEQTPGDSEGKGKPGVLQCMGSQKSQTELSDCTTMKIRH